MALLNYTPPITPYLDIIYQDDVMVVLNKPSGLLSVPGKAEEHQDSLEKRVRRVFPTASIVHRLDMATSGIMVMALTKAAQRSINQQFATRRTQKEYIAKVFGILKQSQGSIDLPLICDWPNRPKQKVCQLTGKPALTHYQLIVEKAPDCSSPSASLPYSRVRLQPITGRSHQLRVHMLNLGHPILGDRLYAPPMVQAMASRLQLHAQQLTLFHPITEQPISFTSPCPF